MTERSDGGPGAAFHLSKSHHFLKQDFRAGKKKLDIATACLEAISSTSEEPDCIAACTRNDGQSGMGVPAAILSGSTRAG